MSASDLTARLRELRTWVESVWDLHLERMGLEHSSARDRKESVDQLVQVIEAHCASVVEAALAGRPEPPLHAITCPQNSLAREIAKLPNVWGDDRCNCGATETFLAKHLADEVNEAHQQLDKLGAPKTKMVPNRSGGEKQEITVGLAERISALRAGRPFDP